MSSPMDWVWFGVAVIVIGAAVYWDWQRRKKLIARMTAAARQRGWTYEAKRQSLCRAYRGAPFKSSHNSEKAEHVITGTYRDRQFIAFQYRYKMDEDERRRQREREHRRHPLNLPSVLGGRRRESDHKHSEWRYYHVYAVSLPATRPFLEVSKEGLFRGVLDAVGIRDLQLESEEFNKTYKLKTDNNKFAYDILHPRMMEWMLNDGRVKKFGFTYQGNEIWTYRQGRFKLEDTTDYLDYLHRILERAPSFVWKD
ncbi:hypothetical protein EV191_10795 [Tamaricihabitans halophyticus]|uniref:DUF3137 domain-containing protein n=2 Tax=Tamaricihabitans halophyticus TaxID=1262583 RepID=A0A4R2QUX3_9PSEU|nr:hypothetical protein EV191_10795 [Tamaricihabitans halophyticus]